MRRSNPAEALAGPCHVSAARSGAPRWRRSWIAWLLVVLLYVALRANTVAIPLDRDEGVFGYAGQVILGGGLPYRDVVDHKPPVIHYAYALALLIAPPTATGIHVVFQALNFLTLLLLAGAAAIWSGSREAGLWTAFTFAIFSAGPHVQGFTASTEMCLLLPLAAGLVLALVASRRERATPAVLSGACGALALLTKQTVAPVLPIVWLLAGVARPATGAGATSRVRVTPRLLAAWSAGALLTVLVVALAFHSAGLLPELAYWTLGYNLGYVDQNVVVKVSHLLGRFADVLVSDGFLVGLAAAYAALATVRHPGRSWLPLGFLLLSLATVLPGYAYPHYFAQLAPAVALLSGLGLEGVRRWARERSSRVWVPWACAATILVQPLAASPGYFLLRSPVENARSLFGINPFPEAQVVASYLTERTTPEDLIFVSGSEPEILLMSERRSPTPFVYVYPLTSAHPRHVELQARAWRDIQANPPIYLVMVDMECSMAWDGQARLPLWRELAALTSESYTLEAVMTVESPMGTLLTVSELRSLADPPPDRSFPIRIYRRIR